MPPVAPESGAQPLTFRKGVVIAFNPADGSNVINVAGANLTDLPMLVSGAETALIPGQTVGIAVVGTAMFIMGRVSLPRSPGYASASNAFVYSFNSANGFPVPNAWTTYVMTTLSVPPWASRAVLIATSDGTVYNDQAFDVDFQWGINIFGQGHAFGWPDKSPAKSWLGLKASNTVTLTVTPGGTVAAEVRGSVTGPGFAANGSNGAQIQLAAIFTSG